MDSCKLGTILRKKLADWLIIYYLSGQHHVSVFKKLIEIVSL